MSSGSRAKASSTLVMSVVESPPKVVVPLRVISETEVASRDVSSRLAAVASRGPRREVLLPPIPKVVADNSEFGWNNKRKNRKHT